MVGRSVGWLVGWLVTTRVMWNSDECSMSPPCITNNERGQEKNAHYTQTQCQHTKLPPITNANRKKMRTTHKHNVNTPNYHQIPNTDRKKMRTTHKHNANTPNYHQYQTRTGKKCVLRTNTMQTHQSTTNNEREQGKCALHTYTLPTHQTITNTER